jgi:hypothetical protein
MKGFSCGYGAVSGRGACVGGSSRERAGGGSWGSSQLDLQADRSLPGRGLRGPRTTFQAAAILQTPNTHRDRGGGPQAPGEPAKGRPRCWRGHDCLPPRLRDRRRNRSAVCLDDLADPQARRLGRPATPEAATQQPDPLRSRPTERDVADRHHPLAARPHGEHVEIMNMIDDHSACSSHPKRSRPPKPKTSWTSSTRPPSCTACQQRS